MESLGVPNAERDAENHLDHDGHESDPPDGATIDALDEASVQARAF